MRAFAFAAFLWAVTFAAVSTYWAFGGGIGVDHLARTIQDQIARDDATLMIQNALGIAAKLVWAGLALLMWRRVGGRWRRLVVVFGWLSGVLVTLYGLAGIIEKGLMQAGVIDVAESIGEDALVWYLLLWDPWWLLGGLLFLGATWEYRRGGG